jgi:hypothetical protein
MRHTRRALLAASPALPVALAAAPAIANPDAALLALCQRHAEASRRADHAAQAVLAAEDAAAPFRPRLPAARARADLAARALYAIEARALETPATTLEGFRAKARVVAGIIGEPDGTFEDHAARVLLADLLAGGNGAT